MRFYIIIRLLLWFYIFMVHSQQFHMCIQLDAGEAVLALSYLSLFKPFLTAIWLSHRKTLGHSQGVSITYPILITVFQQFQPKGQLEYQSKVAYLIPPKCLVGLELEPSNSTCNALTHHVMLLSSFTGTQSQVITAESSTLHIASSRTQNENLWLLSASC